MRATYRLYILLSASPSLRNISVTDLWHLYFCFQTRSSHLPSRSSIEIRIILWYRHPYGHRSHRMNPNFRSFYFMPARSHVLLSCWEYWNLILLLGILESHISFFIFLFSIYYYALHTRSQILLYIFYFSHANTTRLFLWDFWN